MKAAKKQVLVAFILLAALMAAACSAPGESGSRGSEIHRAVSAYRTGAAEWIMDHSYPAGSSEALFSSGMDAYAMGDYAGAKGLFEQALDKSPSDPALPVYLPYYINRCDVLLSEAGNPQTVAAALSAIRQYAPLVNDTDILWDLISSISLSDGSDETAIGLMEQHLNETKGLELSTWAWLRNCIALLEYNNQEYAKSIRDFYDVELALEDARMTPKLETELRYAKEYIANIHYIFEDYEAAAQMYQELIDMALMDETFHAYASCINMASVCLEIPDTERARAAIGMLEDNLSRVEPDIRAEVEASVQDVLANICLLEGNTDEAATHLRQAEAFYQANTGEEAYLGGQYFTMLTRCKYLSQTGGKPDAQAILEDMAASGNAAYYGLENDVYELLREIYGATGQNDKQIAVYEKLMELNSEFHETTQREYLDFSEYYRDVKRLEYRNNRLYRIAFAAMTGLLVFAAVLIAVLFLLRQLRRKNMTDQLTGVYNRKKLTALHAEYQRLGTPDHFGVVMMDIDYFKRYNDNYGHPAGDEVLRQVATALTESVRKSDIVIRYGGEEFLALLSGVSFETAQDICARIHRNLKDRSIPHAYSDAADHITLSMGLCYQQAHGAAELEQMIKQADECLFQSKENGRNRLTAEEVSG